MIDPPPADASACHRRQMAEERWGEQLPRETPAGRVAED